MRPDSGREKLLLLSIIIIIIIIISSSSSSSHGGQPVEVKGESFLPAFFRMITKSASSDGSYKWKISLTSGKVR